MVAVEEVASLRVHGAAVETTASVTVFQMGASIQHVSSAGEHRKTTTVPKVTRGTAGPRDQGMY